MKSAKWLKVVGENIFAKLDSLNGVIHRSWRMSDQFISPTISQLFYAVNGCLAKLAKLAKRTFRQSPGSWRKNTRPLGRVFVQPGPHEQSAMTRWANGLSAPSCLTARAVQ